MSEDEYIPMTEEELEAQMTDVEAERASKVWERRKRARVRYACTVCGYLHTYGYVNGDDYDGCLYCDSDSVVEVKEAPDVES